MKDPRGRVWRDLWVALGPAVRWVIIFTALLVSLLAVAQDEPALFVGPCPREMTLHTGERFAPPAWSDPACRAAISWQVR